MQERIDCVGEGAGLWYYWLDGINAALAGCAPGSQEAGKVSGTRTEVVYLPAFRG
jgi:hypothetical protein